MKRSDQTLHDYSVIDTLDDMPLPACRLLPDSTVVDANDAYCRLLGTEKSVLLGRKATDFESPESAEHLRRLITRLSPEQPVSLSAKQPLVTDDQARWMIWNDYGIFDAAGELQYIFGFCWNITEERRYSEALESLIRLTNDRTIDTETMLHGILDIGCSYYRTPVGVITREVDNTITPTYVVAPKNTVTTDKTIPFDESFASIACEFEDVVAIDDLGTSQFTDRKCYKRNPLERIISAQIHVDGKRFGTIAFSSREAGARRFSNEDIQLCKLLVQWVSFTLSRQNKTEDISKSEETYRQVFDHSPLMMFTMKKDRKIAAANHAFVEKLGYAREEVIGEDITHFMTPQSAERSMIEIARSFGKPGSGFQREYKSKNGSIIETELATLNTESSLEYEALAVLTDVTDRNRAQRSLQRGNAELLRANEGLKRFNAIAAHDLQEPLRKIGIFGGILEEALRDSDNTEVLEALMVVVRSSQRLSKLVRDLLTYSQQSAHDYTREPVDLAAIAQATLADMDLKIRESQAKITIEPLPQVRGDRVPIERLFFNLLNNALTYNRLGHPPEVHVFPKTLRNGDLEIVVRDNGIGIPPEAAHKIFEPFARLQPTAFSGTGIGLAMCKSIAEGHGWQIHSQPRDEVPGSDFILAIPRACLLDPA